MKLQYDEPLSNFAFHFHLRRYTKEDEHWNDDGYSVDDDTSYRGGDTSYRGVNEKNVVVKLSKQFLSALDATNTREVVMSSGAAVQVGTDG